MSPLVKTWEQRCKDAKLASETFKGMGFHDILVPQNTWSFGSYCHARKHNWQTEKYAVIRWRGTPYCWACAEKRVKTIEEQRAKAKAKRDPILIKRRQLWAVQRAAVAKEIEKLLASL